MGPLRFDIQDFGWIIFHMWQLYQKHIIHDLKQLKKKFFWSFFLFSKIFRTICKLKVF